MVRRAHVLRRVKGLLSHMSEDTAGALFVAGLFAVAALAIAGTVLHERGVWFSAGTARALYRVLWALLWLPGLALCVAQFARARRLSLALGIALQAAALVAYEVKAEWLGPAAAAGFLGLLLPLEVPLLRRAPWRRRLWSVAMLLVVPALFYDRGDGDWGLDGASMLLLLAGILWVYHAAALWPQVAEALDGIAAQDEERSRRAKLWVRRTIAWIARPWRRAG
jgi:hypothetical protein